MAENKKALYSTAVACLGFVCFAVGATAVGLPLWGYFDSPEASIPERGYFGPWQTCKQLLYGRERCGVGVTRFKPVLAVWLAGVVAALGVTSLGVFCVFSVLQLAMVTSRERVLLPYKFVVAFKLALALLATVLAIIAASLFAFQTDSTEIGFQVSRGESFYIQVVLIGLNFTLFIVAFYDVIFSRRANSDPTMSNRALNAVSATTFNNPGFREPRGVGISVTDASGRPYVSKSYAANGSVTSVTTMSTLASNGSTIGSTIDSTIGSVTRSPLRSSLKKPKPKDGMGIQNPGFSGLSPTLSRNGSVKKVRIQTHSTAV